MTVACEDLARVDLDDGVRRTRIDRRGVGRGRRRVGLWHSVRRGARVGRRNRVPVTRRVWTAAVDDFARAGIALRQIARSLLTTAASREREE